MRGRKGGTEGELGENLWEVALGRGLEGEEKEEEGFRILASQAVYSGAEREVLLTTESSCLSP